MFTIDAMKSPLHRKESDSTIPITRMAWSKDSTFLAALAIREDIAYITVWDMKHWNPSQPRDTSILEKKCAVGRVEHGGLGDLSIGLAISADGRQVAIYQEPMVGQWGDDSELKNSTFPFCLLSLQAMQDSSRSKEDVLQSKQDVSEQYVAVPMDSSAEGTHSEGLSPKSDNSTASLDGIQYQSNLLYEQVSIPHYFFSDFIGYGAFLTEANDHSTHDDTESVKGRKGSKGKIRSSSYSVQSTTPNNVFAACNGIYMDIFKIKSESNWEHTHAIKLTDLTPTINRRVTCSIMMDTISRNAFMWLEDGGTCCMIWDLQDGSSISYLSSSENTKLGSPNFRGNNTMSISPDESMVALATIDGTLATFYADTGLEIDHRKFPEYQIEYVAFHGQSSQLFVILKSTTTSEISSRILDPLQLRSQVQANEVPVPIIGRTILAFFCDQRFKNKGFVFKAIGSKIHCYVTHEPADNAVAKNDGNAVPSTETFYPSPKNDSKAEIEEGHKEETSEERREEVQETTVEGPKGRQHEVRIASDVKPTRDDDDSMCWVLRVEVVERDLDHHSEKVVFSFVPEPWVHISASEVHYPEGLMKAYFLPGQECFVVVGMQTMQIWSLPTNANNSSNANANNSFNLVFIWSRPRMRTDSGKLGGFSISEHVKYGASSRADDSGTTISNKAEDSGKTTSDEEKSGGTSTMTTSNKAKDGETTTPNQAEDSGDVTSNKEMNGEKSTFNRGRNSRKAAGNSEKSRKAIEMEPVGEYYHHIQNLSIYLNQHTEELEALIKLKGASGTEYVSIPRGYNGNPQLVFLNCARSIHLLAASYAYSDQERKKFSRSLEKPLTFKEHAEAIARFTRSHINRLLSRECFRPSELTDVDTPAHDVPAPISLISQKRVDNQDISASTTSQTKPPALSRNSTAHSVIVPPRKILVGLETSEDLCKGLTAYVDTTRERFHTQKDEETSPDDILTVLTLLLDQIDLRDTNHVFIEGLFDTDGHEWAPHPSMALNPIERLIDIKNERLLTALIAYCIRNARHHHPGYLTPVIQCLSELSELHPDVVSDLFRKASYIPARNPEYVASHAIVANLHFSDWINFVARFYTLGVFSRRLFSKSSDINHYKASVFGIQSQLPIYVGIGMVSNSVFCRRNGRFPQRRNTEKQSTTIRRTNDIFVSPFQFKLIKGRDGRRGRSFLAEIAGKDFFDSPAIEASLWYKW
jgi:hypothetical protein